MRIRAIKLALLSAGVILTGIPTAASAYVGPGAGITAIGSVLALLAGILLAVVGFIWYPLKRFFRSRFGKPDSGNGTVQTGTGKQDKTDPS